MSELKGQLLGIILVILVFGGVATMLATSYKQTAKRVQDNAAATFDDASDVFTSNAVNNHLMGYYDK